MMEAAVTCFRRCRFLCLLRRTKKKKLKKLPNVMNAIHEDAFALHASEHPTRNFPRRFNLVFFFECELHFFIRGLLENLTISSRLPRTRLPSPLQWCAFAFRRNTNFRLLDGVLCWCRAGDCVERSRWQQAECLVGLVLLCSLLCD